MNKKIIFTGGGTAGHVMPNIVLIKEFIKDNWEVAYIGSEAGMERELIEKMNVKYYAIATGKFRRYFDFKNFTDPFRVIKGVGEAISIISKVKPDVIFSKGGFVAVPVVIAGSINKIPVIIHESDMTPGLANKISAKFSKKICVNFPETLSHIDKRKGVLTGTPIREELFTGNKVEGRKICDFDDTKPIIMVTGGSTGSKFLNNLIRDNLSIILKDYQIVHLCGKGNIEQKLNTVKGYKQFEFVSDEISHIFAMSDMVISRAGANTIYELMQLLKPNILIPLSAKVSRGDQILNAKSFEKQGFSKVLDEDSLNINDLMDAINSMSMEKERYIANIKNSKLKDGKKAVVELVKQVVGK